MAPRHPLQNNLLPTRLIAGATSGIVLSAVFATALTLIAFGETFIEPLRVDPSHPAPITLRMPRLRLKMEDPRTGRTRLTAVAGTVGRGKVTSDQHLATLVREYENERRPPPPTQLAAQWFLAFVLSLTVTAALRHSRSDRGALLRTQVGLLGASLALLAAAKTLLLLTDVSTYLIPVAVVPLWTSLFLDRRTGVEVGLALALLHASLVFYDPLAVAVFASGSGAAALLLRKTKHSLLVLWSGMGAALAAALAYVAAKEALGGFSVTQEMASNWRSGLLATAAGGLSSGVIAFVFNRPIGRMLGAISRAQLLDLTDVDHPLLRRMAAEAPGSWEHSRAMANLAEAAAAAVGANAALTRVGSYFHDVGKLCQPEYFVENLEPGQQNPHEGLDPVTSADAIMAHVVEGTRLLRDAGIPEPVVEFVYTHHGTGLVEFFWHKYREQGNPDGLTEEVFRYPGMRPRTREAAIVMLVDSIEAAARTVEHPSRERLEELVQRMVFAKLKQGQMDESGFTLSELKTLMHQITDTLCRVHHSRVRYPWQEEDGRESNSSPPTAHEEDVDASTKEAEGSGPLAPLDEQSSHQEARERDA